MFRIGLILSILLSCSSLQAQVARYKGKNYTPESFPRATWCSCTMCQNLRRQWGMTQTTTTTTKRPLTTVTRTKTVEPRYKTVDQEYRVWVPKMCVNGVCIPGHYETRTRKVRVKLEEPYTPYLEKPRLKEAPTPTASVLDDHFEPTPQDVVLTMIGLLELNSNDIFYDPGCGDARLVIEASKAGATAVGIEISPKIAQQARENIKKSKVDAKIITASFEDVNLDKATAVALYLYDDLIEDVLKQLKPGTRIVSYMHEIPGCDCKEIKTSKGSIFLSTVPDPNEPTPVLFGLN